MTRYQMERNDSRRDTCWDVVDTQQPRRVMCSVTYDDATRMVAALNAYGKGQTNVRP